MSTTWGPRFDAHWRQLHFLVYHSTQSWKICQNKVQDEKKRILVKTWYTPVVDQDFHRWRRQPSGALPWYDFIKFSPKLHEIEKNLIRHCTLTYNIFEFFLIESCRIYRICQIFLLKTVFEPTTPCERNKRCWHSARKTQLQRESLNWPNSCFSDLSDSIDLQNTCPLGKNPLEHYNIKLAQNVTKNLIQNIILGLVRELISYKCTCLMRYHRV